MVKDLDYYMGLKYKVELIPDEDGTYAVRIPKLRGCISCGDTVQEALEMIEDAKKCWLEAALEDGINIPEPGEVNSYSGEFRIRMPKSLHQDLAIEAEKEGISMNQYCIYLLSKEFGKNKRA
ncbi:type II toxin-antitoxin system HicB family antitoxin [Clostridium sp. JN-1]|uniref:type II toxin-antitoxin system HicB family antitoxin n=1 Tax=Clostridium sp. JN-1 TaxID=2483110 RepID=UPI000F0B6A7A|nr:type II toxin-antitoxin system HicB family antitoxin [Clostridium sp. JN-1]